MENFLLARRNNKVMLKLCDFGSATDVQLTPNDQWTVLYRGLIEDEIQSVTTPAYRPPELLNTYDNKFIGCPMDMWSLGCCYYQEAFSLPHPFLDCARLRILNADYRLPVGCDQNVKKLIRGLLEPDPNKRMTAKEVLNYLNHRKLILNNDLEFLLTAPNKATSVVVVSEDAILKLTSRIWLLTSVNCPPLNSNCFIIENIPLCVSWLNTIFLKAVDNCLNQYQSILLHEKEFGRTAVGAASIFSRLGLCRHPETFLYFINSKLCPESNNQADIPASARRYVDYMFQDPLHFRLMCIKQIEVLPGNEPFSISLLQLNPKEGKEMLITETSMTCDWQKSLVCTVFGDVILRINTNNKRVELRFNTMFVPVTECELCFESKDMDYFPFGDQWIESLIIDFMFTTTEGASFSKQNINATIASDAREMKAIRNAFHRANEQKPKFFTSETLFDISQDEECKVEKHTVQQTEQKHNVQQVEERNVQQPQEKHTVQQPEQKHNVQQPEENCQQAEEKNESFLIDLSFEPVNEELPSNLFSAFQQYSKPAFDKNEKPTEKPSNIKTSDPFEDLFKSGKNREKMTLMDMKKLQIEKEESEPINLKRIREWASSKNIITLLCQLNYVLPSSITNWVPPILNERSKFNDVKKCYRQALLLVHPDKHTTSSLPDDQREICRLIFIQLSESWVRFQNSRS